MLIRDAIYRVIDTEGTDKEPTKSVALEVAWEDTSYDGQIWERYEELLDPGVPIPPTASAIHHYVDEDVVGKKPTADMLASLRRTADDTVISCWVAHNAEYDSTVLKLTDKRWLCTHRLAKHLWPEIENHSNQVIRYTLKLKPTFWGKGNQAHTAAYDVAVTAEILRTALPLVFRKWPGIATIEELIEKVKAPCVLHRIPFAGHGFPLFTEAEEGLLYWIINKQAGGEDCVHTAQHELNRREEARAAGQGFGLVVHEDDFDPEDRPRERDDRTADMFEGL